MDVEPIDEATPGVEVPLAGAIEPQDLVVRGPVDGTLIFVWRAVRQVR